MIQNFERAEDKKSAKSARVVVSVAFNNKDFKIVSSQAERLGKKISEFIREAALAQATGKSSTAVVHAFGSTGCLWCDYNLPSTTQVQSSKIERGLPEPVTTY